MACQRADVASPARRHPIKQTRRRHKKDAAYEPRCLMMGSSASPRKAISPQATGSATTSSSRIATVCSLGSAATRSRFDAARPATPCPAGTRAGASFGATCVRKTRDRGDGVHLHAIDAPRIKWDAASRRASQNPRRGTSPPSATASRARARPTGTAVRHHPTPPLQPYTSCPVPARRFSWNRAPCGGARRPRSLNRL